MTVDDLRQIFRNVTPQDVASKARVGDDVEMYSAIAAMADGQMGFWAQQSQIATATGIWLDQHGRDRGVYRQTGETDDQYRARLSVPPTAGTVSAIFDALSSLFGGIPGIYVVELPRQSLFLDRGIDRMQGLDRGFRCGGGRGVVIALVPTGTTLLQGAKDLLRIKASAGKITLVQEYTP